MDGKCRFCGTRKSRHAEAACGSRHVSDLRHDNERLVQQAADMATELAEAQKENKEMSAAFSRWWCSAIDAADLFNSLPAHVRQAAVDAALLAKEE